MRGNFRDMSEPLVANRFSQLGSSWNYSSGTVDAIKVRNEFIRIARFEQLRPFHSSVILFKTSHNEGQNCNKTCEKILTFPPPVYDPSPRCENFSPILHYEGDERKSEGITNDNPIQQNKILKLNSSSRHRVISACLELAYMGRRRSLQRKLC